ncbi:sulfite exporter TauE/SafE family protein [Soonwooa sp.]|uniref:sulfite exporter TauE/SafE family protein n=1 Tax=Soonwooa sp. TaxID=1938592 RepID=UPI0026106B67|nr:sulfite exporter TauE/SafE family protein [Soonwooa sp.]
MEIALLFSALFLGFASGFHCIGMCGPIALSMGLTREQRINFYLQNLTYNFGRVLTYSILGAIIGIVGESFNFAGLQTKLSIAVGVLLILMAFFSFGGKDFATKIPFVNKALLQVKIKLSKLLTKADLKSRFTTGLLNGLLPCGMVYMALTASIAAGGIWQSALYMFFFGLGTFPFMFAVVVIGNFLNQSMRLKIVKIVPIVMIILGGLFILRGLELGIPYLSPKKEALQIKHHNHGADPNDHTMCH